MYRERERDRERCALSSLAAVRTILYYTILYYIVQYYNILYYTWCYIGRFPRDAYEKKTASAARCDMVSQRAFRAGHLQTNM